MLYFYATTILKLSVIGWPFGKTIDAELAVRALKNAALNVKCTQGIIIPALNPGTTAREFIQGKNYRTPEAVYSECENLAH